MRYVICVGSRVLVEKKYAWEGGQKSPPRDLKWNSPSSKWKIKGKTPETSQYQTEPHD